jgi:site-specific recombinase XerC
VLAETPLDPSALHLHFKKWLERAGLPATIEMHELRHSAADNLWRETGNLLLAQRRHTCTRHGTTSRRRSHDCKS